MESCGNRICTTMPNVISGAKLQIKIINVFGITVSDPSHTLSDNKHAIGIMFTGKVEHDTSSSTLNRTLVFYSIFHPSQKNSCPDNEVDFAGKIKYVTGDIKYTIISSSLPKETIFWPYRVDLDQDAAQQWIITDLKPKIKPIKINNAQWRAITLENLTCISQ